MNGFTLDAGALVVLNRSDRHIRITLARTKELGFRYHCSNDRFGASHAQSGTSAFISQLIREDTTDLVSLDEYASQIGVLLARSGTADSVDANVVICAERAGQPVITRDLKDSEMSCALVNVDLDLIGTE